MNGKPLRLILATERDADAVLVLNALMNHGYKPAVVRVDCEVAFREALAAGEIEMILCGYAMAGLDALTGLKILQESDRGIPLIVVSSTMDESIATSVMQSGAVDYFLATDLLRLGFAVERELRGAQVREEAARANQLRYLVQRDALIKLTKNLAPAAALEPEIFREITETCARTLHVSRVSIWRVIEENVAIEGVDLFDLESNSHTAGTVLFAADAPRYFLSLSQSEPVAAGDACWDIRTRELSDDLNPPGITSMMDVPIRRGNGSTYLLCHEHTGHPRHWTEDEKTFAAAIANIVSLALESRELEVARQELSRSHLRFQSVAAATNDTIWDWNLETDELWWNDGFANLFGWASNEPKPSLRTWIRQIHPEDRKRVMEGVDAAIAGSDTRWSAEYRFIDDNGTIAHVLDRCQIIRNDAGKAIRMVGGMTDVTANVVAQRTQEIVVKVAQAVSSGTGPEFFDLLTRNMVEALGGFGGIIGRHNAEPNSIDTVSFFLDGKLMENTTYSLVGTPCEKVLVSDLCVFEENIQQLFPDDHMLVEMGAEAYAGIPLLDHYGVVAGIMAVLFSSPLKQADLVRSTLKIFAARAASELDRRQADARIREQASLLDKAQDAILVRDLTHTVTYWNKSAERLYGWSAAEAVGKSVKDLIYRDKASFDAAQSHTLQNGEWLGEINQVDKTARDLIVEGRWTLVRDPQGRPKSVFVINTDITENRRLEHQFLRAQRLESIGTLAGGIAHDLNNILAPISMAIELLRMRLTDQRATELLDTIATSAARGADMVGQVLSFARGMEGRRVEVDPRALILEIQNILRNTVLRNITLEVRAGRELWTILGDPTQLHQVLLNLCVNARDALEPGGKVSISADNVEIDEAFAAMNLEAKEGPHVSIQVEDTGSGIPAEIMDKIFDPFFTTKTIGKGTGLGLSTSLAIVRSHGGFICATSIAGKGTRVRMYLPARPDLRGGERIREVVELPRGNGEMILVVDDEDSIRQLSRQVLEAFGYRTVLAANGAEAIFVYEAHGESIDLVLTDMMMPVMDGAELIGRLCRIDPRVRIVATSGISTNRGIAGPSSDCVKNFLPKPYTAETLLKCLREVLEILPNEV